MLGGAALHRAADGDARSRPHRSCAAPAAACAATVIFGSSLAALRARKVPKWFGRAGLAGGVAVLGVGARARARPAGR